MLYICGNKFFMEKLFSQIKSFNLIRWRAMSHIFVEHMKGLFFPRHFFLKDRRKEHSGFGSGISPRQYYSNWQKIRGIDYTRKSSNVLPADDLQRHDIALRQCFALSVSVAENGWSKYQIKDRVRPV